MPSVRPWRHHVRGLFGDRSLAQEFASLATRETALAQAAGTLPTFVAATGVILYDSTVFARASQQFLNGGLRDFNIQRTTGFTAVAVVMFTGSAGIGERIIDAGNVAGNKIILSRNSLYLVLTEL